MQNKIEIVDIAIIGGGPGGSTLASLMSEKDYSVAVFEEELYPRFHIGESLLPFSKDIFEKTGVWDVLKAGKYIEKYGARFIDGVTEGEVYFEFAYGLDPHHPMAFEVPREQFDTDLLEWAKSKGAKVYQPESVTDVSFDDDGVTLSVSSAANGPRSVRAKFLADATGRSALVSKKLGIRKLNPDINNVGVFSHFKNVRRAAGKREGDISIGLLAEGAWCWVIPFKGDLTSIGVVCPSKVYREGKLENYIEEKLSQSKILTEDIRHATRVRPVGVVSNYSHTCDHFFGDRWILIGDAAAFLDPIFSSGVHLSVSSAWRASIALDTAIQSNLNLTQQELGARFEREMRKGIKRFHSLIRLFYDRNFVADMKKTLPKPQLGPAFTSALAGDVWNDQNPLFERGVL